MTTDNSPKRKGGDSSEPTSRHNGPSVTTPPQPKLLAGAKLIAETRQYIEFHGASPEAEALLADLSDRLEQALQELLPTQTALRDSLTLLEAEREARRKAEAEVDRLRRMLRGDHAQNCAALDKPVKCNCGWLTPGETYNTGDLLEEARAEIKNLKHDIARHVEIAGEAERNALSRGEWKLLVAVLSGDYAILSGAGLAARKALFARAEKVLKGE